MGERGTMSTCGQIQDLCMLDQHQTPQAILTFSQGTNVLHSNSQYWRTSLNHIYKSSPFEYLKHLSIVAPSSQKMCFPNIIGLLSLSKYYGSTCAHCAGHLTISHITLRSKSLFIHFFPRCHMLLLTRKVLPWKSVKYSQHHISYIIINQHIII